GSARSWMKVGAGGVPWARRRSRWAPSSRALDATAPFLPGPERSSHAHLEADVAVEPHAADLLADGVDHRPRRVEVVELEDQVPRPATQRCVCACVQRPNLEDVVAERGDDARAELLPPREYGAEARQEDVALLVLGRLEVRGQPAAEDEHAVRSRPTQGL